MKIKVLEIKSLTYNVKRFRFEKPRGYTFIPGQAVDVSLDKFGWENQKHPFTFTSLNSDPFLEFTIKEYSGFTKLIHELKVGDELIIGESFGTINYKGKGVFIAGGAGITPFIAIFKELVKENKLLGNKLIFTNKTKKDVILESWLRKTFPLGDLIITLTRDKSEGYYHEKVDGEFLSKLIDNFNQYFYICGKGSMVKDLRKILPGLGVEEDKIVFEK